MERVGSDGCPNSQSVCLDICVCLEGSCFEVEAGLEHMILFPQPPDAGVAGVCTTPGFQCVFQSGRPRKAVVVKEEPTVPDADGEDS